MNISGVSSLSWYATQRSTTSTSTTSASSSAADSASISAAAFASLLSSSSEATRPPPPPQMTDAMAQSIGSALQENNPDLFTALDSDEDGSLSASELRSAMEAMRPDTTSTDAAQEDGSALFSALDTNQDGTISSEELQAGRDAMRQAMQDSGVGPPPPPSDDLTSSSGQEQFQANLMNEILRSLFADSTAS